MPRHLEIIPTLSDVLYQPPNPDGSRKRCDNCCMFLPNGLSPRCFIHAADKFISSQMVCGYHVYGTPMAVHPRVGRAVPGVEPELSGLIWTLGTSCDRCVWYQAEDEDTGLCMSVREGDGPAEVEALGCCARWTNE